MSDLKMTQDHLNVLQDMGEYLASSENDDRLNAMRFSELPPASRKPLLSEILSVIQGLADGSLRCADSTQVIVSRDDLESVKRAAQFIVETETNTNAWNRLIDLLDRWLSTPEQPAPTEESK